MIDLLILSICTHSTHTHVYFACLFGSSFEGERFKKRTKAPLLPLCLLLSPKKGRKEKGATSIRLFVVYVTLIGEWISRTRKSTAREEALPLFASPPAPPSLPPFLPIITLAAAVGYPASFAFFSLQSPLVVCFLHYSLLLFAVVVMFHCRCGSSLPFSSSPSPSSSLSSWYC